MGIVYQQLKPQKGDYFHASEIAKAKNKLVAEQWDFMQFCEAIWRETKDTAKQEGAGVRVLTDWQASQYNYEEVIRYIARIEKRLLKLQAVDRTQLTIEQGKQHDQRLTFVAKVVQSNRKIIRKEIPPMASNKLLPKINLPSEDDE